MKTQASEAVRSGDGSFTLAGDGSWSYTADDSQTAIQQLGAGQSLTDSFTAVSSDGTANRVVTVTIHGTNEVPSNDHTTTLHSPDHVKCLPRIISTNEALPIADFDAGQSNFTAQASPPGSIFFFNDTATTEIYSLSPPDALPISIQQLGAGQSLTDTFTAVSSDGTASHVVTVTIHGTNEVPVIGGVSTGEIGRASCRERG